MECRHGKSRPRPEKHEDGAESLLHRIRHTTQRLRMAQPVAIESEAVIRTLDGVPNDAPARKVRAQVRAARIERADAPILSAKNHQLPTAQLHGLRLPAWQ